jgi:hypothetical protein
MKIIFLVLALSLFLLADSIKTDLVVTFHDLTLEQAAEIEKIIQDDFKDYNVTLSISSVVEKQPNLWWGNGQVIPVPDLYSKQIIKGE